MKPRTITHVLACCVLGLGAGATGRAADAANTPATTNTDPGMRRSGNEPDLRQPPVSDPLTDPHTPPHDPTVSPTMSPPPVLPSAPPDSATPAPRAAPAPDEFAQMDLDHDGRISASEYAASPQSAIDRIAAGKRSGPAGPTGGFDLANNEGNPERSRFFRRLDLNKDGFISREELQKAEQSSANPTKH